MISEAAPDTVRRMIRNSKRIDHPAYAVASVVAKALDEDRAGEDLTTLWTVPAEARVRGHVEARAAGTIAGVRVAERASVAAMPRRS